MATPSKDAKSPGKAVSNTRVNAPKTQAGGKGGNKSAPLKSGANKTAAKSSGGSGKQMASGKKK